MDIRYTYLDGIRLPVIFFASTDLTDHSTLWDDGLDATDGVAV